MKKRVRGGELHTIEKKLVLSDLIEITFDEGVGGINSDKINLTDPALVFEDGKVVDFTTFEMLLKEEDSKRPLRFDMTFKRETMLLKGKEYDRGLGVHANTKIVFIVPERYRNKAVKMHFKVGIDSRMELRGDANISLCLLR